MGDCGTCFEINQNPELLIRQTNQYPWENERTWAAGNGRKAAGPR